MQKLHDEVQLKVFDVSHVVLKVWLILLNFHFGFISHHLQVFLGHLNIARIEVISQGSHELLYLVFVDRVDLKLLFYRRGSQTENSWFFLVFREIPKKNQVTKYFFLERAKLELMD